MTKWCESVFAGNKTCIIALYLQWLFPPSLSDKHLNVRMKKNWLISLLLNPPKWNINFRSPLLSRAFLSFVLSATFSPAIRHVPDFLSSSVSFSLSLSLCVTSGIKSWNLTRQVQYDIVLGKATALYGHVITARDCCRAERWEWRGMVSRTVREAKGETEV